MVREKHQIIDQITRPKYSFYKWQTINLQKACIIIGMLKQFHNAIFFKVSFILPDRIVKIKTD